MKKTIELSLLLLLFAFVLSGCGTRSLTTVDINIINAIVGYFVTTKALNLAQRIDRHKAFFIFHRTEWLGARNGTWLSEINHTSLKGRLESEFTAVENYILSKDDFFHGKSDHPSFPHLDIANVSRPRHARRSRDRQRATWYRRLRKDRSICIIWRAAALYSDKRVESPYSDIWIHSSDNRSATLRTAELDLILDRRLRAVERMQFQVAATGSDRVRGGRLRANGHLGSRSWQERSGPTGPWRDKFRVRMFEYARVASRRTLGTWEGIIGSSNIGTGKDWEYGQRNTRLEYNGPLYPGDPDPGNPSARLPVAQQSHWVQQPGEPYRFNLHPSGITGSEVLDDMFKTHIDDTNYRLKDDWWHRSWLFCDHAMAAINLDALIFGLRRGKGNADEFNQVVQDQPGYVSLCWFVGRKDTTYDKNIMMVDDDDPYFENTKIEAGKLQIGDQLIFWNSQLYGLISRGDWRLENAYVMDVDSNSQGGIDLNQLVLQGHGTGLRRYPGYRNTIASKLNYALDLARREIRDRVDDDSSVTQIDWFRTKLIKWSPFGATWRNRVGRRRYLNLGAWWVLVPVSQVGGNVSTALSQLRRAFRVESDFVRPTFDDGSEIPIDDYVFFPLFEPAIRMSQADRTLYRITGTWGKYIAEKRSNPAFSPRSLKNMRTDGILMPGIERRGENQPIPIVRCKYKSLA